MFCFAQRLLGPSCVIFLWILLGPGPSLAGGSDNPPEIDCSEGGTTTYEMNYCGGLALKEAEGILQRYLARARTAFAEAVASEFNRDTEEGRAKALRSFDQAQASWEAHRQHHCQSVYYLWRGGTIRGQIYLACQIDMVKKRSWTLWSDYLALGDGTPSLPEPDFGAQPLPSVTSRP